MVRFRTSQFLQTSEATSWLTVWQRKLLNGIFRRYYIALHAFPRNFDLMSPKSRKQDKKSKKIGCRFYVLPVSVYGHSIPLVSRLGQSGPRIFWIMLKCSQKHEACKVLAQSPEPVWRYCDLNFKHKNLAWIRKFSRPFRVQVFHYTLKTTFSHRVFRN